MNLFEYIEFQISIENTVKSIEMYGDAAKKILVAVIKTVKEIKEATKEA